MAAVWKRSIVSSLLFIGWVPVGTVSLGCRVEIVLSVTEVGICKEN